MYCRALFFLIIFFTNLSYVHSGGKSEDLINTKNIHYTDLREAHTKSRLVDPSKVDISKRPKTIGAMKSHRGKRIEDYTDSEWAEIQSAQLEEKKEDETRQINLKNIDEDAFIKYDKIHKLMLTNVYQ